MPPPAHLCLSPLQVRAGMGHKRPHYPPLRQSRPPRPVRADGEWTVGPSRPPPSPLVHPVHCGASAQRCCPRARARLRSRGAPPRGKGVGMGRLSGLGWGGGGACRGASVVACAHQARRVCAALAPGTCRGRSLRPGNPSASRPALRARPARRVRVCFCAEA
jgi:hypothetical protein